MKKPNLVYVFADQLRYQSVGYAGDKRAKTPYIDELAAESLNMDQAVSGHPVCSAYRASLLTGKYTTSTGMVINEIRMNTNHESFANVLSKNGYETAYIGKWHMYAAELGNHYDTNNSYIPVGPDRLGFNGYFAAYNFHHEYYGSPAYYHLNSPKKIYMNKYEPDEQVDMTIEELKRLKKQDKPFALFLSIGTVHDPWIPENVPGESLEKFDDVEFDYPENYLPYNDEHADSWARLSEEERRQLPSWMKIYYGMASNLDDNIGRLWQEMKKMKLDDDTIFVFTADHGEMFGAHGRRAKNIFYEEAIRVPFLIYWKGKLEKSKNSTVFNAVDIMPTLLGLMGLDTPSEVEGSDRSELLLAGKESDEGALMMVTGPTAAFGDGYEWRGYRTKEYVYATYKVDGKEFLFNHQEDPLELNNLAEDPVFKEVKEELKSKMYQKMAEINDNFELNSYYEKNWIENRLIKRTATINADKEKEIK